MADKPKEKIGQVTLKNVRLSFAHLFDPQEGKENEDGTKAEPKYNCSFLFPKDTPEGKAIAAAVKAVADRVKKAKWGDNIPKLKPEKVCMRDGDLEDYDGYAGMFFVSASSPLDRPPVLVDRDRSVLRKGCGKLYSGCYVNGIVDIWAQDNKHGKRVNASIEAVQFVKHGDAFGAKPVDPNEAFDVLDGDDDLSPVGEDNDDGLI